MLLRSATIATIYNLHAGYITKYINDLSTQNQDRTPPSLSLFPTQCKVSSVFLGHGQHVLLPATIRQLLPI